MRKRVNLSMSEEMYNSLQRIAKEYHFKNVCEVAVTLLGLFLKQNRKAEDTPKEEESDEDVIREMFSEFEQWEPTPQPGHVPRIHRPRRGKP